MSIVEDREYCSECGDEFFDEEYEAEDFDENDVSDEECTGGWGWCRRRCRRLGRRIAWSAVEFEDTLAMLLRCFVKLIWYLIKCGASREELAAAGELFRAILEQVCCIETRVVEKLELGLEISGCRRRICLEDAEE